jgi:hypothetical protein
MTARRVKASLRKITSRSTAWTSRMIHSQNANGFVCGLSTRKALTPSCTQCTRIPRQASHISRQAGESQLKL